MLNQNNPNETEEQTNKRLQFESETAKFRTQNGWLANHIPQTYTVIWCALPNGESIYFTDLYAHRNEKYKSLIKKYKGKDTAAFLQEKLAYLGLTPKEYNEFIVFWLPKMQNTPYNLITFQGKSYTDHARLNISPKPVSLLRVFMVYQPLKQNITIPEQKLSPFKRKGFTVIEWGGTEYPSAP